MVFQDPASALNPRHRVATALTRPLTIHGWSQADAHARAVELLDLTGLPATTMASFPHQLNTGERQRVVTARALTLRPRLLLADEAVSRLDVSMQSRILNLLLGIRDELGVTVVFITHDLSVVRQVADRVAVMYLGRLMEICEADHFFSRPTHPYSRALMDSTPQFHATPTSARTLHGEIPSPVHPARLPVRHQVPRSDRDLQRRCARAAPDRRRQHRRLHPPGLSHGILHCFSSRPAASAHARSPCAARRPSQDDRRSRRDRFGSTPQAARSVRLNVAEAAVCCQPAPMISPPGWSVALEELEQSTGDLRLRRRYASLRPARLTERLVATPVWFLCSTSRLWRRDESGAARSRGPAARPARLWTCEEVLARPRGLLHCADSGPAEAPARLRGSDHEGEFVECNHHSPSHWLLGGQLVLPSPHVLDEGVPADDHSGSVVLFEPTHQPRLQPAVVALDAVVGYCSVRCHAAGSSSSSTTGYVAARSVITSAGATLVVAMARSKNRRHGCIRGDCDRAVRLSV